jgi:hypothetical protein
LQAPIAIVYGALIFFVAAKINLRVNPLQFYQAIVKFANTVIAVTLTKGCLPALGAEERKIRMCKSEILLLLRVLTSN